MQATTLIVVGLLFVLALIGIIVHSHLTLRAMRAGSDYEGRMRVSKSGLDFTSRVTGRDGDVAVQNQIPGPRQQALGGARAAKDQHQAD